MELNKVISILNKQHKGTFVRIGWRSNIESAKARNAGITVVKEVDATVRWGINYDNLRRVKALRAEEAALNVKVVKTYTPWYKHLSETPHIIQHLKDPAKTYLQLFTINKKNVIKSRYYINGVEHTKQQVIDSGYVNASEWAQKDECLIMNIPITNIRYIGKQEV